MTGNKGNVNATGRKAVEDKAIKLDLSNIQAAVRSLTCVVELYANRKLDIHEASFARLVWAITTCVNAMKTAKESELEGEIAEIKETLNTLLGRKTGEKDKQIIFPAKVGGEIN